MEMDSEPKILEFVEDEIYNHSCKYGIDWHYFLFKLCDLQKDNIVLTTIPKVDWVHFSNSLKDWEVKRCILCEQMKKKESSRNLVESMTQLLASSVQLLFQCIVGQHNCIPFLRFHIIGVEQVISSMWQTVMD